MKNSYSSRWGLLDEAVPRALATLYVGGSGEHDVCFPVAFTPTPKYNPVPRHRLGKSGTRAVTTSHSLGPLGDAGHW